MSATVRTDCDQSVVGATLEALEDLLKSLKTPPFPMQERVVSSLMVSVQDIVEYKVHVLSLLEYSFIFGSISFLG